MATMGKFARICIEMDLTKPLKPKFILEGKYYNIKYESLQSFCFLCGRIDHPKKACRFKEATQSTAAGQKLANSSDSGPITSMPATNDHLHLQQEEETTFGPWMLVNKRGRKLAQSRKRQDGTGPIQNNNRFRYLENNQGGPGDHGRGKKTTRAGAEKAQTEIQPTQMGSHLSPDPKSKTRIGQTQPISKQPDPQLQPSISSIPMEECSTYQHSDTMSDLPDCHHSDTPSHPNDRQDHLSQTNIVCTGNYPTRQTDLTMVEVTHMPTQVALPLFSSYHATTLEDHQQKEAIPPDPGELKNGEARSTSPTQARGATSSEVDQCSGTIVRTRDQSNSPRRFRLVDRATTADNRTKLGE